MKPSRRQFLACSAATVVAGCEAPTSTPRHTTPGPDDTGTPIPSSPSPTGDTGAPSPSTPTGPGPEPSAPWDPGGALDALTFATAVQTCDATDTSVLVSCRQHTEPELRLVLARGVDDGWLEILQLPGLIPDAGVVQVELIELIPDTTYSVVLYAPDGQRRSPVARFRTAPPPGAQRLVRLGATSCLGSAGAPWPTLSHVATEQLDAFLLLGDTIYADEGWAPAGDWEAHWAEALATQGLRDLCTSTSVVATWDDHEVDNDWSYDDAGMPDDALEALEAFRRALPWRANAAGSTGLWRSLAWGDTLELFVLDCRGERIGGDYISQAQMDWLKAGLLQSTARFKLILSSVPITDMDSVYLGIGAGDRWDGHPAQRTEILTHIDDNQIGGVLWVAGDFHWGAIARVGRDPGDPGHAQTEVFAGPAGSTINPLGLLAVNDPQYQAAITQFNAVILEADPAAGTIRVVFIGDQGSILEEQLLSL